MTTLAQRAVPVHALRLAKNGDARALLAIPDARLDIPRLIEGRPFKAQWTSTSFATGAGFYSQKATDLASRKAITAAKQIVFDRDARRAARVVADAARIGTAGRFVAKLEAKRAAFARKRQQAAAKREAKIQEATKEAFRPSYKAAGFRTAAQGSTWTIRFGDPSIESDTEEGWIDYKRHGWRRGIKSQKIIVTIPLRWDTRVGDRALGIIDGLLTLDAEPIKGAPEGIELYRATWARQGRGLEIGRERGIIARHTASGMTYHSTATVKDWVLIPGTHNEYNYPADPKAAIAGLKRKLTAQGVPADVRDAKRQAAAQKRAANRAAQLTRLITRIASWDFAEIQHVVVRRADSLKAGNCDSGTDQFINRFFPDRSHDASATIGEIASRIGATDPAKLAGADLTLARQLAAAALVAIRKDKQARRALAI